MTLQIRCVSFYVIRSCYNDRLIPLHCTNYCQHIFYFYEYNNQFFFSSKSLLLILFLEVLKKLK